MIADEQWKTVKEEDRQNVQLIHLSKQILDLTEGAIAALTIFSSGAATAGIQAAIGPAGTGLVIIVFVILGNAAAGGPFARRRCRPSGARSEAGCRRARASIWRDRRCSSTASGSPARSSFSPAGRPWGRCSRSRWAAGSRTR